MTDEQGVAIGGIEGERDSSAPAGHIDPAEVAELLVGVDQGHNRVRVGEAGGAGDVATLDPVEVVLNDGLAVLGRERGGIREPANEVVYLVQVAPRVGDGDENPIRAEHSGDLGQAPVEVGQVIEHPVGENAAELGIGEWEALDVAHPGVQTSGPGQLDHPRGQIQRHDLGPELSLDPLGVVAGATTNVQDPTGGRVGHGRDGGVFHQGAEQFGLGGQSAGEETLFAGVLPRHGGWVVHLSGAAGAHRTEPEGTGSARASR